MARAEEAGNMEIGTEMGNIQNDLLRRFMPPCRISQKLEDRSEEDIELSLGLSLNGRFGVDPVRAKKLARSSSVADLSLNHRGVKEEELGFMVPLGSALTRTCSLPTETEEEWRKRKELQTQRRMEAKRKRTEKQRNLKSVRRVLGGEEWCEDDKGFNGFSPSGVELKAERGGGGGSEGLPPQAPPSQGSVGSLGSGSSGISDLHSQPVQGMNKCTEVASPSSVHSVTDSEHKSPVTGGTTITEKTGKFSGVIMKSHSDKHAVAEKEAKNVMRNVFEEMPCVSTKGDGPNGKRIEGFLYRYRKGEEVKIVCVCHGSFLSPAEFIKHAGGGDVEHPLKHIVVSSSPFL